MGLLVPWVLPMYYASLSATPPTLMQEGGLYLTTVCYRLGTPLGTLKWVMLTGTTVHGVTRVLQFVLVTIFFVGEVRQLSHHRTDMLPLCRSLSTFLMPI